MVELSYFKIVHRDYGITECKIIIDQSTPFFRLKLINNQFEEYDLSDIIEFYEWTKFVDRDNNKIYFKDKLECANQTYNVVRYLNAESHYYHFPWIENINDSTDNQLLTQIFCSNSMLSVD